METFVSGFYDAGRIIPEARSGDARAARRDFLPIAGCAGTHKGGGA